MFIILVPGLSGTCIVEFRTRLEVVTFNIDSVSWPSKSVESWRLRWEGVSFLTGELRLLLETLKSKFLWDQAAKNFFMYSTYSDSKHGQFLVRLEARNDLALVQMFEWNLVSIMQTHLVPRQNYFPNSSYIKKFYCNDPCPVGVGTGVKGVILPEVNEQGEWIGLSAWDL